MKTMIRLQAALFCCLFLFSGPAHSAKTIRVAAGLREPVQVIHRPGDNRMVYIVSRLGYVYQYKSGARLRSYLLDISDRIETGFNEQGLLSIAFHPNFPENQWLFVNYTRRGDGMTMISRFTLDGANNQTSEEVLLQVPQPYRNHNGGHIFFGPGGNLWIGMGDGGSAGDPQGHSQNDESLLGKILRINVDQLPYKVPNDNPWRGNSGRDAVWAKGVRNPWRMDIDPLTHDLYIADVGQNLWEWIHINSSSYRSYYNFGWNTLEGDQCFPPNSECDKSLYEIPEYAYSHREGCSITGGHIYRGRALPELHGHYFFADYCAGWIRSLKWNGKEITKILDWTEELTPDDGKIEWITSFGRDAHGELYICCHQSGDVFKIVPDDFIDENRNFIHDPAESVSPFGPPVPSEEATKSP